MSTPIPLPASLEAFVAYQEQLINRSLSKAEIEVTSAWLERLDQLIDQSEGGLILRFLEGVRCWLT